MDGFQVSYGGITQGPDYGKGYGFRTRTPESVLNPYPLRFRTSKFQIVTYLLRFRTYFFKSNPYPFRFHHRISKNRRYPYRPYFRTRHRIFRTPSPVKYTSIIIDLKPPSLR